MRFALSEDHLAFQDAVREVLTVRCPPAVVRAVWDGDSTVARALWSELAAMDVLALGVPEAQGGIGSDELALVPVAEELGRAGYPLPLADAAMVAAPLLAELGSEHLRDVIEGRAVVALGWGSDPVVPGAAGADLLVLIDDGPILVVPREQATLSEIESADGSRRLAHVQIDGIGATTAPELAALATDRAVLSTAAQLLGVAQRMLDMTAAYTRERTQFGAPIGSFQAVQHMLVDALLELEFARPAVARAAHSVAHRVPERSRDVSMAKALAGSAAHTVGRAALQCHGAIGYTVEHDLHLWLKRSWALTAWMGSPAWHRDRVGRFLGV